MDKEDADMDRVKNDVVLPINVIPEEIWGGDVQFVPIFHPRTGDGVDNR